ETTLETSRSRFRARAMARGRASLERDVVVHVVEVVRGLARRRRPRSRSRCGAARPGRSACRLSLAREAAVVATTAPVARAEQLHRLGDDLGGVAVLPFLVLPLARLQTTFDVDRPALPQVFTGDFGEAVIEDDRVPLGFLALLARGAVFPVARGGDAYVADRAAARSESRFGIAPEVADEDHLVHRSHVFLRKRGNDSVMPTRSPTPPRRARRPSPSGASADARKRRRARRPSAPRKRRRPPADPTIAAPSRRAGRRRTTRATAWCCRRRGPRPSHRPARAAR